MSTTAKDLLNIMSVRLKMQEDGITSPAASVRAATKQLVARLQTLLPKEEIQIEVVQEDPLHVRYIRTKTGQILAEIHSQDT